VIVRDSAGITIVESHGPTWVDGRSWTLSELPVVTIGTENGVEEYSLYQVRSALRLPDGAIVIANGGTDELRYYDSSGTFLYAIGNDGFGPGEFKDISGMWLVTDTLVIQDGGQDRTSVFSASGEYLKTVMLHREPGSNASGIGVFSDGSILGQENVIDGNTPLAPGFNFIRANAVYRRHSSIERNRTLRENAV
jgi:hypothetical protein